MFYYIYMNLSYVLECHAHMATHKTPSLFPRRVLTNLISPFQSFKYRVNSIPSKVIGITTANLNRGIANLHVVRAFR